MTHDHVAFSTTYFSLRPISGQENLNLFWPHLGSKDTQILPKYTQILPKDFIPMPKYLNTIIHINESKTAIESITAINLQVWFRSARISFVPPLFRSTTASPPSHLVAFTAVALTVLLPTLSSSSIFFFLARHVCFSEIF